MAFDPAAIHVQRRGFNPPLGVREIQVAQFRHANPRTRRMPFRRRIATQSDLLKPITCKLACLLRSELAYAPQDKAPRAAFAIAVLDKVGLCSARLNAHTKALERAVACIPFEYISSARVWPQYIDSAFCDPSHGPSLLRLLPWPPLSAREAWGKQRGSNVRKHK